MSTGLYVHRRRYAGEIVTAPLYNTAHQNQLDNDVPVEAGAHSDTVAEFRTTKDPTTGDGVTALPVDSVALELEQLRFVIADIKTVLNGGVPPTYWYSPITTPTFAQVQAHGARVYRPLNQLIPGSTTTPVIFQAQRYDTGVVLPTFDPFWSALQPTRLTARVSGLYHITGFGEWATGVISGTLALYIRVNGSRLIAATQLVIPGTAAARRQQVGCQYQLAQNDYVELVAFQTAFGPGLTLTVPDFGLELLNASAVISPPTLFTLTVATAGTGTGTVTWSPTNTGSTSPEPFVSGTVVQLTAAPDSGSAFAGWSGDVPPGHENDNPLSITMDANKNITATFDLIPAEGAIFIHTGNATTYTTTNKYGAITEATDGLIVGSTLADMQVRAPANFTVTAIYVKLTAAPGLGNTVKFAFNVNGSYNNAVEVSITGTDTTGTAAGTLSISQDDLLAIEAAFAGIASIGVDHISVAYTSPV